MENMHRPTMMDCVVAIAAASMRARLTCTARVKNVPARGAFCQGLTLVHFSAQPKPSSSHYAVAPCLI
jgi:hypothetical protein